MPRTGGVTELLCSACRDKHGLAHGDISQGTGHRRVPLPIPTRCRPRLGTAQLSGNRPRSQDSPFCVSFVEQTSVEIWKLSRADTVKPDAPPPTRNEDPERSLGSGRFLVEGSARYELASSSFLLSPCKQSTSHRQGTPRAAGQHLGRGVAARPAIASLALRRGARES